MSRVPWLLRKEIFFVWSQRESDNVVFLSAEVLDFCRTKWQQFKHCPKKETSDSCLIDPFCVTIWSSSLIKRLKKLNTRSPYWHKTLFLIYFSAGNQLTPSKVVWSICQLNRKKNKLILREQNSLNKSEWNNYSRFCCNYFLKDCGKMFVLFCK